LGEDAKKGKSWYFLFQFTGSINTENESKMGRATVEVESMEKERENRRRRRGGWRCVWSWWVRKGGFSLPWLGWILGGLSCLCFNFLAWDT
jgi:hypothetical protein